MSVLFYLLSVMSFQPNENAESFVNSVGQKLVLVSPGEFIIGGVVSDDELPTHRVQILRPYYLGVTEVSIQQYKAVMFFGEDSPKLHDYQFDGLPQTGIFWSDAVAFCKKLSSWKKETELGRTYRLPTEAEWEYACRAGTSSKFWSGANPPADENVSSVYFDLPSFQSTAGRSRRPVSVGTANPWGFVNMHGNVCEWTADVWSRKTSNSEALIKDPIGPPVPEGEGVGRVVKGGSYLTLAPLCGSAARGSIGANSLLGFRVACDLKHQ